MTASARYSLRCPSCKRLLDEASWSDSHQGVCRSCTKDFELISFPAFENTGSVARGGAVQIAEDATCYFHTSNRADHICEGCGRFLCPVCSIDYGGRRICPGCISQKHTKTAEGEQSRVLYDQIALGLAAVPLLIWFFTCVTAPVALGMVIYAWKKPSSLVAGNRTRLVIAGLLSVAQIVGWIILLFTLAFAKSKVKR